MSAAELREHALLRGLSADAAASVLRVLGPVAERMRPRAGALLPQRHLRSYFITGGRVWIVRRRQGRSVALAILGAGELVDPLLPPADSPLAAPGEGPSDAAEVLRDASVVCVPRVHVIRAVGRSPAFAVALSRHAARRAASTERALGRLLLDPDERVADALAELASFRDDPLTHRELADAIDLRRPTVSHAIRRLRERGLVAGRRPLALDADRLAAFVAGGDAV